MIYLKTVFTKTSFSSIDHRIFLHSYIIITKVCDSSQRTKVLCIPNNFVINPLFCFVIIRSEGITFQMCVLLQKVSGVIPMGLLFGTRYLPLFRFQVTYHLYCKSGVIVFISTLRLGCTFREGESSREITTLKMEIQQIMKGEVPAYLER